MPIPRPQGEYNDRKNESEDPKPVKEPKKDDPEHRGGHRKQTDEKNPEKKRQEDRC